MAVKGIPNVTIPGFGQYQLYSFSYAPGLADGYGSIDAEFLNKTGVYPDLDLTDNSFFNCSLTAGDGNTYSLGSYTPVSYDKTESGQYKILKVKFADKSVNLDRYLIALRGQVGYDQIAFNDLTPYEKERITGIVPSSGRLIWVGTSDENCKEVILDEITGLQDACDPCEQTTPENVINVIDCDKYYLRKKRIYQYTLKELIESINSSAIGLYFSAQDNFTYHKFEYVGTVREVLTNICSELGLTFYYDPSTEKIEIIDVRNGIAIDVKGVEDVDKKCKILEKNVSKSKEDSVDVFGAASFQREGEEKSYSCDGESCRKLNLMPFTLEDLFEDAAHFTDDIIAVGTFRKFEFYSLLTGRVGSAFRDMFLWYHAYQFKTAAQVEAKLNIPLYALNGMEIQKVFWAGSATAAARHTYRLLNRINSSKNFDEIKKKGVEDKAYYFVAKINEKWDERIHSVEKSICDSFLGQYWMRRFKQHWKNLSYNTISPDGSIQYYDFKSPINLPFADIVLESEATLKNCPLLARDENGTGDSIASGEDPHSLKARDTFFLMNRPAAYFPQELEKETEKKINLLVEKYLFKELAVPIDFEKKFKNMAGLEDYSKETHRVFVVDREFGPGGVASVDIVSAIHPLEQENVIMPVEACGKHTSYGLRSAKTKKFNVIFKDVAISLMMPVQSFVVSEAEGDEGHSGYIALLERSGGENSFWLPKTEIFSSGAVPAHNSPNLKIEFNSYNASSNDLQMLARTNDENYCDINTVQAQALLLQLSGLLNYSVGHKEQRTYKLEGVPYDFYYVNNGLKSFSISLGSSGVTTSLTFNNQFPFKLSPDLLLKKLRYMRLAQIQSAFPGGSPVANTTADLGTI